MLIVFSGLPGVGKTAIARELARTIGAVHVRIDSIEQALCSAGFHVEGEGYEVAYAVAEDNLRAGRTVIADCVNPWPLMRGAWRSVAERAGVAALDVEIVCSDAANTGAASNPASWTSRATRFPLGRTSSSVTITLGITIGSWWTPRRPMSAPASTQSSAVYLHGNDARNPSAGE
jgi:DNA polymerase III delta prime subunit